MLPALLGIGLGLSAIGTLTSMGGSKKQAEASKNISRLELQAEAQRMKAMEMDSRRKQMEILRNQQRARSMALTVANSQGASGGSGLQGAYGQIAGQSGVNALGVNNALTIGRNIFGINAQISQQKMNLADAGSTMAMGSGLSSLGNTFMGGAGTMAKIGREWGG